MWCASAPAKNEPNGAMPMNIIEYTAITRPRSRSGTIAWISVFDDAICSIIEKPSGISTANETQNHRDCEKQIIVSPNPADAIATHRALVWPARQDFREDELFRQPLANLARTAEISREDLLAGRWRTSLPKAVQPCGVA